MPFTKENIKAIRTELTDVLNDYATVSGFKVQLGTIKFDDNSFKLTVKGIDDELPGEDFLGKEFLLHCEEYGFEPEDLGKNFKDAKGNVFILTGIKKKNRKYPVIAENVDTKKPYKFAPEAVKFMMINSANEVIEEEEVEVDSDN
jgi:hypothetical protein